MIFRHAFEKLRCGRESILKGRVLCALALHRRGEVRADGLELKAMSTNIRIEWIARDIHPWDRGWDRACRERLFADQCLRDADAVIHRLFEKIPELDTLELRVFYRGLANPLLAGMVKKSDLIPKEERGALGMKLKTLGVTFKMSNWQLEPLSVGDPDSGSNT